MFPYSTSTEIGAIEKMTLVFVVQIGGFVG